MLLVLTMLLAPAALPPAGPASGPGDRPAVVHRRRPSGQCRVLGLSPLLAPERSTPPGGRRARTDPTTTDAESTPRRESAGDSGGRSVEPSGDGSSSRTPRRLEREGREGEVRAGPFFSAARTLDLRLGTAVRSPAAGDARVELRLYTPKGHLYQTLRTSTAAPTSPGPRGAEGRSAWPLEATLPVAGTAVVNHSLYGRWTVEPYLEGHSDPCGPSLQFWIDP